MKRPVPSIRARSSVQLHFYTSTHRANFSVCHAYLLIRVVETNQKFQSLQRNVNVILSSTSQSKHIFIVGDLNINLLDPPAIEDDFINNCHSNSIIPLINKPTRDANNQSILDHIWSNQLYDTFNDMFLLDINWSLSNIYHCTMVNITHIIIYDNIKLINNLSCTTPDTEQIVILILHFLIIQKLKNVFFLSQVIPIWNSLPSSLKNCTSKFTLKKSN